MSRFRPLLAAHGVTEQQWRVIRILGESGPLDATELSKRCVILMPSLTRIIRTLTDRKLITRSSDRSDGRRIALAVTPKARTMIISMLPDIEGVYAALELEFGQARLKRTLDVLETLAGIGR